ncbi:MAG: hypothetical protein JWR90_1251 [Marmoricola sp.]|nr:hypothetical protein [Marmoricola sp.]
MRTLRLGLFSLMMLALTFTGMAVTGSAEAATTSAPAGARVSAAQGGHAVSARKRHHKKKHHKKRRKHRKAAVRTSSSRPQNFSRRTVRAVRGRDSITITWPARANADSYTVAWSPLIRNIPKSPSTCYYPCKYRHTTATSMTLRTADLSTYGRLVNSASGNAVHFKVFSRHGSTLNWTGVTYPWDSWIAPSPTTTTDWVPSMSSQMPAPLPPAAGTPVGLTSFNVLAASTGGWASRGPKVAAQINGTGATIVATQENSNAGTGVPGGVAQYNDLASRLRPSGWALADNRNWDYTLGATRSASTQAARIYYKTAVWSQMSNGALMTHANINGQTTGVNVDRWVSWSKLSLKSNPSTQICVLDAHLLTNLGNYDKASADHRNAEVAQIMSELNNSNSTVRRVGTRVGAACAGVPTVIGGDFNSAEEHAPYGNMPQGTFVGNGFVDTKNAGRRYNTRLSGPGTVGAWHQTWGTQIDYLLARGVGGATSFKVNAITPSSAGSDHYPITAVVNVPN